MYVEPVLVVEILRASVSVKLGLLLVVRPDAIRRCISTVVGSLPECPGSAAVSSGRLLVTFPVTVEVVMGGPSTGV